jgi:hypothetical protein
MTVRRIRRRATGVDVHISDSRRAVAAARRDPLCRSQRNATAGTRRICSVGSSARAHALVGILPAHFRCGYRSRGRRLFAWSMMRTMSGRPRSTAIRARRGRCHAAACCSWPAHDRFRVEFHRAALVGTLGIVVLGLSLTARTSCRLAAAIAGSDATLSSESVSILRNPRSALDSLGRG